MQLALVISAGRIQQSSCRYSQIACSLAIVLMFGTSIGCKVLFWQDTTAYAGGRWSGEEVFYEVRHDYQTKAHWYALNQNALSRRYKTTILRHRFKGSVPSTQTIGEFPGWTLENSLFVLADRILLIRGRSDAQGDAGRELISLDIPPDGRQTRGANKAVVLLAPKMQLLAAVPSFDGKRIALLLTDATMDNPTGRLVLHLADLSAGPLGPMVTADLKYPGAPGLPNMAWAADSGAFFVQLDRRIVSVDPTTARVSKATRFPMCWLLSTSNVSNNGRTFFRTNPEGNIELRQTEGWIPLHKVPLITDPARIGAGCP